MSVRSVWFQQTPLTLCLGRCFGTISTRWQLPNRVQGLARLTNENSSKRLLSQCHNNIRLRSNNYSSKPSKPSRHSVREKNVSKDESSSNRRNTEKGTKAEEESQLTLMQRFKKTYKEHAKVLVAVHLVTSCVWFGTFFYAAHAGVDVIAVLERLGCSEKIIKPFRSSSLGDVALAYLMYKLATPARYTVTLAGTNYAIRYLRKAGKVPAKQKGLVKEAVKYGSTQTKRHVKQRYQKVKKHFEIRRSKMRRDARKMSTKLKSRIQYVRKNRTFRIPKTNGVKKEKMNGRKSAT